MPYYQAEIIPFEPDPDNAGAGIKVRLFPIINLNGSMEVFVNGDSVSVGNKCSISQLLKTMEILHKNRIAIAINNKVVNKDLWGETLLSDNDKILIIKAAAGG